jgi:hypothetical protein
MCKESNNPGILTTLLMTEESKIMQPINQKTIFHTGKEQACFQNGICFC